jgi:hypothetical protein
VVLDQAGRHHTKILKIARNISLLPVPPRTPSSMVRKTSGAYEQNWLANRVFKFFDDTVDHCCSAWNILINRPWKIMFAARCE